MRQGVQLQVNDKWPEFCGVCFSIQISYSICTWEVLHYGQNPWNWALLVSTRPSIRHYTRSAKKGSRVPGSAQSPGGGSQWAGPLPTVASSLPIAMLLVGNMLEYTVLIRGLASPLKSTIRASACWPSASSSTCSRPPRYHLAQLFWWIITIVSPPYFVHFYQLTHWQWNTHWATQTPSGQTQADKNSKGLRRLWVTSYSRALDYLHEIAKVVSIWESTLRILFSIFNRVHSMFLLLGHFFKQLCIYVKSKNILPVWCWERQRFCLQTESFSHDMVPGPLSL